MGKVTGRRYATLGKLAVVVLTFAAFTAPGFVTDANAAKGTIGKKG